ncbi:MAG: hypothetical protein ACI4WU_04640 [Bacilli bacterium]
MIDVLSIILYILGSILLIVLIILGIKLIITMNKISEITDDISTKLKSLNGFFSVIDFTTDKLATITDKFVEAVTSLIRRIFRQKKEEEYKDE